jgi:predicted cobalt transporter CbtA
MSTPETPPTAPQPIDRSYSGGQIAMIVIGIILLFPGICSVLFALGMRPELNAKSFADPIAQMIFMLWGICLAVSALGVVLIVVARNRARVR